MALSRCVSSIALAAVLAVATLATSAPPALAHRGHLQWWELETVWTSDPLVTLPLAITALLHARGSLCLAKRSPRGSGRLVEAVCFWSGWLALAVALVSPLHWLGERLFVAHMGEHGLLMVAAAPLLVLARPMGVMLWGLPQRWRPGAASLVRATTRSPGWRALTRPGTATLCHGIALWAWHVPVAYEAALADPRVHWLQHVSFLVTALLFWWALLRRRAHGYGIAVLCLLVTAIHSGMLGALIAGARRVVYPLQSAATEAWGLAPLDDQQLAGLVMWVPGGFAYLAAGLWSVAAWLSRSDRMAARTL